MDLNMLEKKLKDLPPQTITSKFTTKYTTFNKFP